MSKLVVVNHCGNCPFMNACGDYGISCNLNDKDSGMGVSYPKGYLGDSLEDVETPDWCPLNGNEEILVKKG